MSPTGRPSGEAGGDGRSGRWLPDPTDRLDRYWMSGVAVGLGGGSLMAGPETGAAELVGWGLVLGGLLWASVERVGHDRASSDA